MKKYLFPNSELPEMMLVVVVVWLCSLILIGLLVTPLFGVKIGLVTAGLLLAGLLILCWGAYVLDAVRRERSS